MFDLLFRKRRLRKKLESLRLAIRSKQSEVAEAERQCKAAWGKKWSYIRMQRRKQEAVAEEEARTVETDGQAEVFEMRRRERMVELKAREQELGELLAKEGQVATELGEQPIAAQEVDGEKR